MEQNENGLKNEFPRSLDKSRAERLLSSIHKDLGYKINYSITNTKSRILGEDKEEYFLQIGGFMSNAPDCCGIDFKLNKKFPIKYRFHSLDFILDSKVQLKDYPTRTIEIVDNVRNHIQNYFEEKKDIE